LTFGELHERFMKDYSRKEKRTWIQDQRKYDAHLRRLADRKLSTITTDELSKLNDKIGTDLPYQANRIMELISVIFNFARGEVRRRGKARTFPVLWQGTNPAVGIGSFAEHKRQRFIDADELPKFFAALAEASPVIRDYVLVSLLTGGRQGNVLSMEWSEIRWQRMTWEVSPEKSKSGKAMDIVLVPSVLEILQRRKDDPSAHPKWIFPSPTKSKSGHLANPWKSFQKVLGHAGLTDIRLHDLRRTLGSWQAQQGTSLAIIGATLGHTSLSATQIYARLNADPIRNSVMNATSAMLALMPTTNAKPN
jgi:integrase